MIDAATNRGFQVEIEVRHVRTQLHELYCTAVDLATSAEMSYCRVVEVFREEFCVDLVEVSVPRSIVMEGSVRSVSGEGHLNGKFPPPKEASTRNRLLILYGVPIVNK
jgi:hypothetical protein